MNTTAQWTIFERVIDFQPVACGPPLELHALPAEPRALPERTRALLEETRALLEAPPSGGLCMIPANAKPRSEPGVTQRVLGTRRSER